MSEVVDIKVLYLTIDKLTEAFQLLESKLKGITVKQDGMKLTVERYGNQMRLCWDGKPVTDCKVEDKIEATKHIESLISIRNIIIKELTNNAKLAIKEIINIANELE